MIHERGHIVPGLQGPTTIKEVPSVTQTLSAQASRLTGITAFATPITDTVRRWYTLFADTFSVYWNSYPLLRALIYTFGAITAIPNAIFLTWVAVTLGIIASIATAGVVVVEGGIIAFALLFLVPTLFVSGFITLAAVGTFTATFYGLRAFSIGVSTSQEITGLRSGLAGGVLNLAKNAAAMSADALEKTESLIIGKEGLPQPVTGRV